MAAFELSRYPKRKTQGKHGIVGLKIDMAKAYDRDGVGLQSLGFVNVWIDRIMTCVSTVTYGVMLHGAEIGPVQPNPNPNVVFLKGIHFHPIFLLSMQKVLALSYKRRQLGLFMFAKWRGEIHP